MKHLLRSHPCGLFRIFTSGTSLFHSSGALPSTQLNDNLHRRIARAGDPTVSMRPVLHKWLDQGNHVKPSDLHSIIKMLRKFNRFSHALQVAEWASEQRAYNLSGGDFAVRLDLISKVRGLREAEKFFESIPSHTRDYHVYGALLNCYASRKSLRKAEATMQKMRELGFIRGPLPYNVMLNLYKHLGKYDMVEKLLNEMDEKNIDPDRFTVNSRLHAYAVVSDIAKMEEFLMKWEADPDFTLDWHTYVAAANAYLKVGSIEKALAMLRRSEQLVNTKSRKFAYEVLMTVYAAAGRKEDVYRLWNLYKNLERFYNTGYNCVISSLLKLDDFDGAEKILEEWEERHLLFDIRIPHLLITGYCKKGMMDKAEEHINRLVLNGKTADSSTWERLALGYKTVNQMEKAVECWKKAILVSKPRWRPNRLVLAACVNHLEGKRDAETVQEVLTLLSERGYLSYERVANSMGESGWSWKIIDAMRDGGYADAVKEEGELVSCETYAVTDSKSDESSV